MGEKVDDILKDVPPTAALAALLRMVKSSIVDAEEASSAIYRAHLDLWSYFDSEIGGLRSLPEVETQARSAADGLRTTWVSIRFDLDIAQKALDKIDLVLDSILGPGWALRDL